MKKTNLELGLCFDDVSLIPQHSCVPSRKDPCTNTLVGNQLLGIPIIAAPMNTVTEYEMVGAMGCIGASSVIHRYLTIKRQVEEFTKGADYMPWVAIGASGDFLERAQALYAAGARLFCIDMANGHSQTCLNAILAMRRTFTGDYCSIMAGNVCTADGARRLEMAGADVIRCGVGSGSACLTRVVTGFGVPQFTAIEECAQAIDHAALVADGGIRSSGDIVKAIAAGADAVMIGGLLAGTSQTPGATYQDPDTNQLFKLYHGMASEEGRKSWFSDGKEVSFVPEGESHKVWHKGDAKKVITKLNNSLKVGMSFAGAMNIAELQKNARWVKITANGSREGNSNRKMYK